MRSSHSRVSRSRTRVDESRSRSRSRSSRNRGHPRRVIVLLEPGAGNPLRTRLNKFRRLAANQYGSTEAHAYPPHVSVTGFWELQPSTDDGDMKTVTNALGKLIRSAKQGEKERKIQVMAPRQAYGRSTLLILPTRPPPRIHNLAHEIFDLFNATGLFKPRVGIKHVDHISLAYYADGIKTQQRTDAIEGMLHLAKNVLGDVFGSAKSVQLDKWDLVFYESVRKAKNPINGDVNVFRKLRKWRVA